MLNILENNTICKNKIWLLGKLAINCKVINSNIYKFEKIALKLSINEIKWREK